jgi:hypothetical protein
MPFQFMCPQGHLLEGTEAMMGQQSQCPLCGSLFIVPVIGPAPAAPVVFGQPGPVAPGGWQSTAAAPPAAPGYPSLNVSPPPAMQAVQATAAWSPGAVAAGAPTAAAGMFAPPAEIAAAPAATTAAIAAEGKAVVESGAAENRSAEPPAEAAPAEERVVRILCPNRHELHTPMEMIGMEALCPQCNAQFLLRYEDSLEYIEERQSARQRRDEAFNKAALKYSIIAAVVIVLALIVMIAMAVMD